MKNPRGFSKRVLVNEMELFNLYKEVEQIRNQEDKGLYREKFRKLLKSAEFVDFEITEKKEGGGHER